MDLKNLKKTLADFIYDKANGNNGKYEKKELVICSYIQEYINNNFSEDVFEPDFILRRYLRRLKEFVPFNETTFEVLNDVIHISSYGYERVDVEKQKLVDSITKEFIDINDMNWSHNGSIAWNNESPVAQASYIIDNDPRFITIDNASWMTTASSGSMTVFSSGYNIAVDANTGEYRTYNSLNWSENGEEDNN